MNNFIVRTLTAIVFVAVLVGATIYTPLSFGILFMLISILCTREFCVLMNSREGVKVNTLITSLTSGLLFLSFFVYSMGVANGAIFLPYLVSLMYLMVAELYLKNENPINNWACALMSQFYIALPFALMNVLAFNIGMASRFWLFPMSLFVFIWLNDAGAYCVGSLLHNVFPAKLFPRISPKKSWVGSIGGGILTVAGAAALWALTNTREPDAICTALNLWQWMGFGLVVVIFATWGDLIESLLKRTLGIKDSGHILPGHGGMLDRFDSSLLAIPAAVVYLLTIILV